MREDALRDVLKDGSVETVSVLEQGESLFNNPAGHCQSSLGLK